MKAESTIVHRDSIEYLQGMESNSVDLIIADPPYNLKKDYGNNSDSRTFDEYLDFTRQWTQEAHRVLKPTGTIYVFMGFRFISYLYQIMEKDLGFNFVNWICWHYTQGIGKKKGFSPRHDDVLMFSKTPKYVFNLDDIRVPQKFYRSRNNMRGANPGDVWEFSHVHYCQENRQNHPTQKPEGLIERMVLASSNKGNLVVDPFSGSGTTLRVCQQLHRNCIGIELNAEYVEMTAARLKEPFKGFDSIDPRMSRIPNDLNDDAIREEYLKNHARWFLSNHSDQLANFNKAVEKKYRSNKKHRRPLTKPKEIKTLFD